MSSSYNILNGITGVVGIGLLASVITWIVKYQSGFGWASSPDLEFNWHPFLMVLGLVFLYSQSILIYRTGRYHTSKKILKYAHALIHLIAFLCSIVGLVAVFDSHNRKGTPNMFSLHSWIGLITVITFALQFVSGFVAFLFPGLSGFIRKLLMPYHVFFGTIAFIFAIITTVAGITEMVLWTDNFETKPPAVLLLNFMGLLAVVYGSMTVYLLLKPDYKRVPLPED
ncbi:transmembrane ascorbate-dependent reductase CYB561-like [Anthonomus grandis grandis]|uniref:transmembrane ascorbate-dependent reductase CYB561-like n=1 Tax=Anthonomus grandis grandis TaxID=2921223 RepID=UPI0021652F0E|nr:transmembrane ascorbate-dependent reductase CYB561-like [Anthonomus grandis grandis]